MFSIRDNNAFADLPTHIFSGLCYAWNLPDERRIVQPLNLQHVPLGNCYVLDEQEFTFLLLPLGLSGAGGKGAVKGIVRSDSPDLLGIWYEQALADGTVTPGGQAGTGAASADPAAEVVSVPTKAPVSHDEAVLTPVWHPDEVLHEESADPFEHSDTPLTQRSSRMPGRSGTSDSLTARAAYLSPATAPAGNDGENPEERAARLEAFMRDKFSSLLDQMTENSNQDLEEEVSRLLALGSTFSWKQKFMFTEFGLALRRKHKSRLALKSHMRALELAPNDEHILFNVARTEYELGNLVDAKKYLNKALSVAPEFAVAKNFQSFLLGRAQ